MTIEKRLASKSITPLNNREFPRGVKFSFDGRIWVVLESMRADNTEMRKVAGDDGTKEVVTLTTLQNDLSAGRIVMAGVNEQMVKTASEEKTTDESQPDTKATD